MLVWCRQPAAQQQPSVWCKWEARCMLVASGSPQATTPCTPKHSWIFRGGTSATWLLVPPTTLLLLTNPPSHGTLSCASLFVCVLSDAGLLEPPTTLLLLTNPPSHGIFSCASLTRPVCLCCLLLSCWKRQLCFPADQSTITWYLLMCQPCYLFVQLSDVKLLLSAIMLLL